jgi:photosystem II stability/assembly factor-like uncharacterized protein
MGFLRGRRAFAFIAISTLAMPAAVPGGSVTRGANFAADTRQTEVKPPEWREITLPYRPVHIAENGNNLWVCGADEMVAESGDGGSTWAVKHANPGGEALLTLSFIGDKTVFASGTNGIMLRSKDAGETWKSWTSGLEAVINLSFGDETHGIRQTKSAVEVTSDGGQNWERVVDPNLRKYKDILGTASLDAMHFSILAQQTVGKSILLATEDGGATWKQAQYPKLWWLQSILARDGEYWAFGQAFTNDRDPGAFVGNLFVHSSDGMTWSREVQANGFASDCKLAGCLQKEGIIATVYDPTPGDIYFPTGKPLTSEWAVAKGNICLISRDLSCASASKTNPPPPRQNRIQESFSEFLDYPVRGCVRCPLYPFPIDKSLLKPASFAPQITGPDTTLKLPAMTLLNLHANVDVTYQLQKDGSTTEVKVTGTKLKLIEDAVRLDVKSWLFQPPGTGANLTKTHKLQLEVGCSGIPSHDDASCIAGLPQPASPFSPVK